MIVTNELLDALPVAVYAIDPQGKITFFNEAAAELWGRRPTLGGDSWSGAERLFWPDGRPMAHEEYPLATLIKSGEPAPSNAAMADRPDGTRYSFIALPRVLRDDRGKVTGAVSVLLDVTDRAHDVIDANRLAAIVASSDDAIIGKTLAGIVTSWNQGAERIFGYTAEEMVGQPITRIIPFERRAEEDNILARLKRGEHIDHYDTVRVARSGAPVDISLTVSPIRDGSGTIVGASKIARDVTDRKRTESTQRLLLAELNHRVKNTLAMVQAMAAQALQRAQTSQHFVSSFTGRVQALARSHDLLIEHKMKGADLADIVYDQVMLGGNDERVEVSGPRVQLDPKVTVHLGLVLHELATNARKHGALSRPDGTLRIGWEVESIPKRQLILDWRETAPVDLEASGRPGFGTSLIERTLSADGGETSLRYEPDGVSCTLRIPLTEVDLNRPGTARPGDQGSKRNSDRRILVIEDEPLIAMDIENELIAAGYTVLGPCASVEDALRMIAEHPADGAVLDANLHGEPVDAVAAALTQHAVPFVFATGYGRDSLPRGFGTAPVLAKPFGASELTSAVDSILRTRSADVVELHPRESTSAGS